MPRSRFQHLHVRGPRPWDNTATLTVATSDPSNLDGREEVKLQSGCDLTVTVAPSGALREAIDYFYHERPREAG